jgi:hypothetical protein
MVVQGSGPEGFNGLSNDLISSDFRSLRFELHEPPIEIGQCFFLILGAG